MTRTIDGLASKPEDKVRQGLSLSRVVCEFRDVFSNELPGLSLQRDVDFIIKLHPSRRPFL